MTDAITQQLPVANAVVTLWRSQAEMLLRAGFRTIRELPLQGLCGIRDYAAVRFTAIEGGLKKEDTGRSQLIREGEGQDSQA